MLSSLLSGVNAAVVHDGESYEDPGGVTLRREQVRMILFEGKLGVSEPSDFGMSGSAVISRIVGLT